MSILAMAGLGRVKEVLGLGFRIRGLIRAANGLSVSSQSHSQSSSQSSSAMDMEIVAEQRRKRTQVLEREGESQANNINIADWEKKSSEILESEAAMMYQMKRVRGVDAEANFAKAEESAMAKHIKSLIQVSKCICCILRGIGYEDLSVVVNQLFFLFPIRNVMMRLVFVSAFSHVGVLWFCQL
jgi:hypothetical protein